MNIRIPLSLSALLLAGGAVAADTDPNWYIVGSAGQSSINDRAKSEADNALRSAGVTGLSSSVDKNDTAYKLQLGYRFNPNFAIEGGYVDLGKFNYRGNFAGGTASGETKASGGNIAALGILPMDNNFSLFGKLGFIDAKVEQSLAASGPGGTARGNSSDTKWKGNWGVGATYAMSRSVDFRAELERFDKLGDGRRTGENDVNLLSLGVAWKF